MRIDQSPATNRADRVTIGRPGTMRDPGRSPVDVLIANLSETGALLKGDERLPTGTLVSLGIPGAGMQFARITRSEPGAMAAEFMVPLDAQVVARARSAETLVSVAFPQIERPATGPAEPPGYGQAAPVPASAPIGQAVGGNRAEAAVRETDHIDSTRAALILEQMGSASRKPTGATPAGLWLLLAGIVVAALLYLLV